MKYSKYFEYGSIGFEYFTHFNFQRYILSIDCQNNVEKHHKMSCISLYYPQTVWNILNIWNITYFKYICELHENNVIFDTSQARRKKSFYFVDVRNHEFCVAVNFLYVNIQNKQKVVGEINVFWGKLDSWDDKTLTIGTATHTNTYTYIYKYMIRKLNRNE